MTLSETMTAASNGIHIYIIAFYIIDKNIKDIRSNKNTLKSESVFI